MQNQFDSQNEKILNQGSKKLKDGMSNASTTMESAFSTAKNKAQELEGEVEEKASSLFSDVSESNIVREAGEFAQKSVKWLRANPKATTAIAVLGGLAVGAIIKSAFNSFHSEK